MSHEKKTDMHNSDGDCNEQLRIALVGNFIDHGLSLAEITTGIAILLSKIDKISEILIYTIIENERTQFNYEKLIYDEKLKLKIIPIIDPKNPMTVFSLIKKVMIDNPNIIIFNMLPTTLGTGTVSNFFFHLVPIILRFRKVNTRIIYHNTPLTNNALLLGYSNLFNKLRISFLTLTELVLFHIIRTKLTLKSYVSYFSNSWPSSKIGYVDLEFVAAVPSFYSNRSKNSFGSYMKSGPSVKKILLFGYWGPQKDLERSLRILKKMKDSGYDFTLTLAGPVNINFPEYVLEYDRIISAYEQIIDNKISRLVNDSETRDIFELHDILLLLYRASGGFSDVLSIAKFYGVDVVANNLPEFKEISENSDMIKLCDNDNEVIKAITELLTTYNYKKNMNTESKIHEIANKVAGTFELEGQT